MMVEEITQVPQSALPLARFRAHLRLGTGFADEALQDGLLAGFLRAALAAVEARTGKALIAREFLWHMQGISGGSPVRLPLEPVSALAAAERVDAEGKVENVLPMIRLTADAQIAPVGTGLPVAPAGGDLRLRFMAGYGPEFDDMPADLQQAVLMLAAHYYDYRSETALGAGCMPFGVSALIERYRSLRIGFGGGQ